MAPPRLAGLTKLTLETAPAVCHECVWWQSSGRRTADKDRWMEKVELEFGSFGTVYYDGDGRVLGSMQYGPAPAFPRAEELPGGPPSGDAMLITCAYLQDESSPWVLQSLFLAAIGEARERGAGAVETFAYRYPGGESAFERFRVHKTVFPADFLEDFGFRVVRSAGRVGLARLELGGLVPATESRRQRLVRAAKHVLLPEPVPQPRRP
ncbi:MAG TPA: hypothetical protein VFB42_12610 [Gaiellaceae bacterium]|nr:hypothetical protein [Gaiellaceae bacterium]